MTLPTFIAGILVGAVAGLTVAIAAFATVLWLSRFVSVDPGRP